MFAFSRSAAPAAAMLLIAATAGAQTPTLDELWPNEDGRGWSYAQHYENFFEPLVIDSHTRIFLDGTTVAPNGIQAQYLRQVMVGSFVAASSDAALPSPLLRQLWRARPDLHPKILRATQDAPCPMNAPPGALGLLIGGELAYRKTADEIAAWRCNLADTRAWIWLDSNLTLGHTFTLRLVPDLASDVYLHGTIASFEDVVVPAGVYEHCLRVEYVVDYGSSLCLDEFGNPLGIFRSETRGYVDYAPGVGPVRSDERYFPVAEGASECAGPVGIGQPMTHTTLQLELPSTAVRRSTWGRLKLTYR